jgi:hypothetical protein
VSSLRSLLVTLDNESADPTSSLRRLSHAQQGELAARLDECKSGLGEVKKVLHQFRSLDSKDPRFRDRLAFTNGKQAAMRERLSAHSGRIQTFLAGINVATFSRIERNTEAHMLSLSDIRARLDDIHRDLLSGRRDMTDLWGTGGVETVKDEIMGDDMTEADVDLTHEIMIWISNIASPDNGYGMSLNDESKSVLEYQSSRKEDDIVRRGNIDPGYVSKCSSMSYPALAAERPTVEFNSDVADVGFDLRAKQSLEVLAPDQHSSSRKPPDPGNMRQFAPVSVSPWQAPYSSAHSQIFEKDYRTITPEPLVRMRLAPPPLLSEKSIASSASIPRIPNSVPSLPRYDSLRPIHVVNVSNMPKSKHTLPRQRFKYDKRTKLWSQCPENSEHGKGALTSVILVEIFVSLELLCVGFKKPIVLTRERRDGYGKVKCETIHLTVEVPSATHDVSGQWVSQVLYLGLGNRWKTETRSWALRTVSDDVIFHFRPHLPSM